MSLPSKLPLGLINHRLVVNHVCVVAEGIFREQLLILKLICKATNRRSISSSIWRTLWYTMVSQLLSTSILVLLQDVLQSVVLQKLCKGAVLVEKLLVGAHL